MCNVASESSMTVTCDCPRRQPPPLPPKELPFPAVEDNREKLEQWLLSYYKASTFNTCHHQPLLPMEGPPLRLMIDPDAKPVACHTPIDVPIHWRDDVKAGLDQDCNMGVIGHPCYLVPSHGYLCKEERQASADGRFTGTQCLRHQGDSPHTETLPPSEIGTTRNEEDGV